jgi:preprotein translocase subunit SecA
VRYDHEDVIYKTEPEKFHAVIEEIREMHEARRPVLVGTASVEKSELVHKMLIQAGIPHNVLNAKFHLSEASIVAQAGTPGAVTLSTNMAGRGTDIVLGGNPEALAKDDVGDFDPDIESQEDYDRRLKERTEEYVTQCEEDRKFVLESGGLHVIGTERHEARRIDNQLRGRSGRQGDPGSSRFFLSLEDDLLRIFGGDKLKGLMERLGMEDGVPLEHPWLTRSVSNAQTKVEGRNFGIRKNLLEYDEVMSQQRDAVYGLRNRIIGGEDTRKMIFDTAREMIAGFVSERTPYKAPPEDMDVDGLNADLKAQFKLDEVQATYDQVHMRKAYDVADDLVGYIETWYAEKEELIGPENARYRERYFLLKTTDYLWKKHLQAMAHLRGGIGLRGYGQRNPLLEYKKEGFDMFNMMLDMRDQRVLEDLFENLGRERALTDEEKAALLEEQLLKERLAAADAMERANRMGGSAKANLKARRGVTTGAAARKATMRPVTTVRREGNKLGRNEPCWCGSGKKYKKCHMGNDRDSAAATSPA